MRKIFFGVVFIGGGLSGQLVLRGTNSSAALVVAGIVFVIWGIARMAGSPGRRRSSRRRPVEPEKFRKPGTYDY